MRFIFAERLGKIFYRCISNIKKTRTHLFDNVFIEDDTLKKGITQWIFELERFYNITIDNLSYFFSKYETYEEIVFPIHIYGKPYAWHIEDNLGKHYYLTFFENINNCPTKYYIETTEKGFHTRYTFELTTYGGVTLTQWNIIQELTGTSISFDYNDPNMTTLILKDFRSILEMDYPSLNQLYDSQISMYFFCLADKYEYFDDVSFIVEYMLDVLKNLKNLGRISLEITSYGKPLYNPIGNIDKILLSKIYLWGSTVRTYFFTTRIDNSILLLHQEFPLEKWEEFISKHH